MADNYLERKMEELRSGGPSRMAGRGSASDGRQWLRYPFRRLRVLVVADKRHALRTLTEALRKLECRTAVFNTLPAGDTDLGADHGVRYHVVSPEATVSAAMRDLTGAWRDIDMVVLLDNLPGFPGAMDRHVRTLPYPNDWGMPVITAGADHLARHEWDASLRATACPDDAGLMSAAASVIPWLCLPANSNIARIEFAP